MRRFVKRVAGWVAAGVVMAAAGGALVANAQTHTIQANKPAVEVVSQWARDRGDLPHDPDYVLGTLPNGMRYLVLRNWTPPRQVAIRMMIDAGSMQERPGEEGVAHFLEHLAFRGTEKYPDGKLNSVLEGLGLQMGDDVNASTGPDRTTFQFDLARNDAESISTGLSITREIVSAMRIAPEMVNAERGVVLSEERARAGPMLEASKAMLKLQLGDHPYGRPPIGLRSVIETVTPETIHGFYDAYYRPERAILLVVGDVNVQTLIPQIEAQFGDWKGRGKAGTDPKPVTVKPPSPDVSMLVTAGAPDTAITLRWFEPYKEREPTKAEVRRNLIIQIGAGIVARRMQGLSEAAGRPAGLIGSPSPAQIPHVWSGEMATSSRVTDVAKTIEVMVKAHRQALEYGVTQEELDRQMQLRLDATKREAERGRTGTSVSQIETALDLIDADIPFISLQQQYQLLLEQAPTITLAEVNAALKARFNDTPMLTYRGAAPPPGGEQGLRDAFKAAMAAPITAYKPDAVKPWPYTDFGKPGVVATRELVSDLNVTKVVYENGVKLTIKPLPTNKDLISVRVRMGWGRLQMPINVIDASDMGLSLWSSGGLNKLTVTEQSRTLAGKRAAAVARTLDDAYSLDNLNVATREDFPLQMQLMAAMITDSAYRADDWASWMAAADASDASLKLTPSGVLERELDQLLHSGDLRWTINTKAQRDSWKPEDSVKYIKPIVDNSPIEVIVIGDVGVETVIQEVGKTLGALPARKPIPEPKGLRDVKFPKAGTVVMPHKGRPDQAYAMIAWPTYAGAFKNIREERIGMVLAQMLRDNATRLFRSEGGATYSPMETVDFSSFLPDYGFIGVALEVAPNTIDDVQAKIQAIATDLATKPVPESEIQRITAPKIEQYRRAFTSSVGYWMELLGNAHENGLGLQYIRSEGSDYAGITPAEIQAAAKKWLKPETAWKLKVVPE
ncbi:MAG TPA: insulinase family protein [Hyphomonadaceae bacterium]|nr:insulinase family protein [Hyphomonadaceae bacterium]